MTLALNEIYQVARDAVTIFTAQGLSSCLCGGTGCALYGMKNRSPNDVDIVVMTYAHDTEELKRILVLHSPRSFQLRPSRKRGATYKILYYTFHSYKSCKVDILIPGIMNIPDIPSRRIPIIDGLPAMTFMPLLLLKLQAWDDHRKSERIDYRMKQHTDARDIQELLKIARERHEHKRDALWLPMSFLVAAEGRVASFISLFPSSGYVSKGDKKQISTAELWQYIGF
ncbi:hypothetical protein BXZ70DRAFT_355039 [Cristinia sonorae]|uniref:Uncharacterized protein n=1 Tax=Cristinia sonorae TaxID=1940300 RepID=A0A8K0ULP3_9AGAR|nr:hypothetical protein BXZ70DRAFT_355039 [Cristinia sonorae]